MVISEITPTPQKGILSTYGLNLACIVAGLGVFFIYSVGGLLTAIYRDLTQPQIFWYIGKKRPSYLCSKWNFLPPFEERQLKHLHGANNA